MKQLNKLTNDYLYINQKLVIAKTDFVATTTHKEENKKSEVKQATTYTVVKGDNLTKIAKRYNTTVALVKQWNKLTSDALFVGQILTIGQAVTPTTIATASTTTNEVPTQGTLLNGQAIDATITEKTVDTGANIETVDEKISHLLANEKEITETISNETATKYAQILQLAQQSMGIPYKYGGNTKCLDQLNL